jgi:NADPH2 dehydrogenase
VFLEDAMADLFTPLTIKGLTLRNRIVLPPMGTQYSTEAGEVTDRQVEHYVQRARGGVGLIIVEHAYVSLLGKHRRNQLGAWNDDLIAGLRRLVDGVHAAGVPVCLQINHSGAKAFPDVIGQQPVGPSAVIPPRGEAMPRPLTEDELQQIAQEFAAAATRAVQAGFDAVEVHGCHGYLLSQFASPLTNQRADEYGSDLLGRFRFPLEVVRAVRARLAPEALLFYRLPADDLLPGGLEPADAVRIAPELLAAGVDVLDLSGGVSADGRGILDGQKGWWVRAAHRVKQATGAPVIGVGGITEPAYADDIVRQGLNDLVAVGRAQLQNPNWAHDAARALGAG